MFPINTTELIGNVSLQLSNSKMDKKDCLIITCFIILQIVFGSAEIDPCTEYKEVKEEYRRSLKYVRPENESPLCDRYIDMTWYRFTGRQGGDMPTHIPSLGSCGTIFPIWLYGELPVDYTTVQATACVVTPNSDCEDPITIKVTNCGDYNVYYLVPTVGCDQAYCIGDQIPCQGNMSSVNGWSPGCTDEAYPTMEHDPIITAGHIEGMVELSCNVTPIQEEGIAYDVYWYLEDGARSVLVYTEMSVLQRNMPARVLEKYGNDIVLVINRHLKCELFPKYSLINVVGKPRSANYFMGFEVTSTNLKVFENGNNAKYEVRPTVPILCPTFFPQCHLSINILEPTDETGSPASCGDGTPLDQVTFKATFCKIDIPMTTDIDIKYNIEVAAAVDSVIDGNRKLRLQLKTPDSHLYHPLWANYELPTAIVEVIDDDKIPGTALCSIWNDPHMRTFDGVRYEHQYQGEFIVYRHKTLPLEVHAYFKDCGYNRATCVCGAAIRSGGDLFIYDFCRAGEAPSRERMYQCNEGSLKDEPLSNGHKVVLPTGTIVKLFKRHIIIEASAADFDNTEGLCGVFNNDMMDDFTLRDGSKETIQMYNNKFSEAWRLHDTDKSLYNLEYLDDHLPNHIVFCSCNADGKSSCGRVDGGSVQFCLKEDTNGDNEKGKCFQRKKRDNRYADDIAEEVEMFQYDRNFIPVKPEWSGTWTEQTAKEYCENYLKSKAGTQMCMKEGVGDVDGAIESCMQDIKLTSDTDFSVVHLDNLMSICETAITKNMSYFTYVNNSSPDGNAAPAIQTPIALLKEICPSDCNGQGTCVDGACQCVDGFTGGDCSFDVNKVPALYDLPLKGLCDIQSRPCRMSPVLGDYFINVESLVCKMIPKKYLFTKEVIELEAVIVKPEYDHSNRVLCPFPVLEFDPEVNVLAYGFDVSMSNDNARFSNNNKTVTIYDSKCVHCEAGFVCSQKANTCLYRSNCYSHQENVLGNMFCFVCNGGSGNMDLQSNTCYIAGVCYNAGDKSPYECAVCDPSVSSSDWTPAVCSLDNENKGSVCKSWNVMEFLLLIIARMLY